MYQAKSNFNHIVQTERINQHRLVTNGVYAVLRHPAYFGWFWWSIGTQVMLCNPICVLAYAAASWNFFANRIPPEEAYLLQMYGTQYRAYMKGTFVGIPFIPAVEE